MKTVLILMCLLSAAFHIQAQTISKQVFGSSGESLSNGSHTINFTVGEPIVGMIQNGVTIHQGFWTELFSDGTLSVSTLTTEDSITVFPNPVVNYLNFHFTQNGTAHYKVALYDINGKIVLQASLQSQLQSSQLDISYLSNGMYLLTLESREINYQKSFKIIKK